MYEQVLAEIGEVAAQVEAENEALRELHRALDTKFEIFGAKDLLPGSDISLADIQSAISTLTAIVTGLSPKDGGPLIPRVYFTQLRDTLKELHSQILSAANALRSAEQNGGIASFDKASFVATFKNGNPGSIGKPIRLISPKLDSAYDAWYRIRLVVRTPRLSEFSRLTKLAEAQNEKLSISEAAAKGRLDSIGGMLEEVTQWHSQADSLRSEIDRIAKTASTDRKNVDEHVAEVTAKLAEIRIVSERAAALQVSMEDYQSSFKLFDEKLETRQQSLADQNEDLIKLREQLDIRDNELKRLLAESEGLLRGATNVGLAASFSALQTKIGKELGWSRFSFYMSIGLLTASTLPLAFYVFPGLNAALSALLGTSVDAIPKGLEPKADTQTLAQIAGRALLLIPGIWLVRFAGARHERLFRLREHYAYKFSVASSVEGFKKQAPDLDQAIAAAAFFDLTFNPAIRMDANSDEARHPNPVMEWVMAKLQASKPANIQ